VYSHNSSQASARSGMSEFCSTPQAAQQDKASHKEAQKRNPGLNG
jgi:hypothetical protein